MVGKIIFQTLILFLVYCVNMVSAQDMVAGKDGNIRNLDGRAMLADNGELYVATRSEIYRSSGSSGKWDSIFILPPGSNEINCLGGSFGIIYAGTKRGLFRSQDYGRTWKNVFKAMVPEKNNVLSIATAGNNPKRLIIGTEGGIFLSDNAGERWQDISSSLKSKRVKYAALINGSMYACTDDGLYVSKTEPAGAWERIYVLSRVEEVSADSEAVDSADGGAAPEEIDMGRMVNCITNKGGRLYIGVGKAILYSDDAGRSWTGLSSAGLSGSVNYIKVLPKSGSISCATTKGVYVMENGAASDGNMTTWRQVYKGTDKAFNANSIAYEDGNEKSMWAITDNGLYKLEWSPEAEVKYVDVEKNMKPMSIAYDNEPSFKELQMAAMDFAEVDPVKISDWRKQARMRALLPKLSVGVDHGKSTNNEIYTSATSRYIITGPDDLDDGWDISVSWELGDLIWNNDQTSIDVRSRLTTQLRNDILDDLRRAYFERKRLQFELMANPPQDPRFRYEKELRVQELTQAIDDLTGNYFSEHLKK